MALNIAFHAIHLAVIALNMLGWMMPRLRRITLLCQAVTLACWVGFGFARGWWGYCPLTDWHWQVLRSLGKTELPTNYISYIAQEWAGLTLEHGMASGLVAGCFGMAVLVNLYLLRGRTA